jgi:hypothetical protein
MVTACLSAGNVGATRFHAPWSGWRRRYCGMGRGQGTPRGVTSPLFGERRPLPVPRISAKRNRWRQHDASVFVA